MNPPDWFAVCAVDDIPAFGSRRLAAGGLKIALIRTEGSVVYALDDHCPHRGGPLSEGIVSADRVACPLHGQCVALATGELIAPDEGRTRRFDVRVEDGQVLLRRADLLAAPAASAPHDCAACG
jgi:nitrite reductase (NADH) small subunit